MDDMTNRLRDALAIHGRFITNPVAVRLAKANETPPQKMKYPIDHIGHRLAVCQGMSIARTYGWPMAFRPEDHACPLPRIFMGHVPPDRFLEAPIADFYQDDVDCMRKMEASYPRWPLNLYQEIWLSPIDKSGYVPDLVVVYGNPGQILTLIHGANFRQGPGITSTSTGRYGCSAWIAGVIREDACTYMIPGPGERIFAGTQDHEMSFAIPYSKFESMIEGLNYVRSKGAFKYPVPNLAFLAEPKIPQKYHEIDPTKS